MRVIDPFDIHRVNLYIAVDLDDVVRPKRGGKFVELDYVFQVLQVFILKRVVLRLKDVVRI